MIHHENIKWKKLAQNIGSCAEAASEIQNFNEFCNEYYEYLSNYKDFDGSPEELLALVGKNFIEAAVDYMGDGNPWGDGEGESPRMTCHVRMADGLPGDSKTFELVDGEYELMY